MTTHQASLSETIKSLIFPQFLSSQFEIDIFQVCRAHLNCRHASGRLQSDEVLNLGCAHTVLPRLHETAPIGIEMDFERTRSLGFKDADKSRGLFFDQFFW